MDLKDKSREEIINLFEKGQRYFISGKIKEIFCVCGHGFNDVFMSSSNDINDLKWHIILEDFDFEIITQFRKKEGEEELKNFKKGDYISISSVSIQKCFNLHLREDRFGYFVLDREYGIQKLNEKDYEELYVRRIV